MAATKIGVVYAKGSGMVRRWIVPDNDAELIDKHPVSPGEAMILVDQANIPVDPTNPAAATAYVNLAVQRMTGNVPPSSRCVILDKTGAVVGSVMADPALDAIDGHTLMLHPTADIGWTLAAGALVAPVISVDPLPVGTVDPASAA